jgi:hypothetical protein
MVVQQKTGRPVQFELLESARGSLFAWLECRGGTLDDYAFPGRIDHADHISTRQYARLVDEWVTWIGLFGEDYGTHSLRRTKASIIYKQTGNLRAVQILLGHTKIESLLGLLDIGVGKLCELPRCKKHVMALRNKCARLDRSSAVCGDSEADVRRIVGTPAIVNGYRSAFCPRRSSPQGRPDDTIDATRRPALRAT